MATVLLACQGLDCMSRCLLLYCGVQDIMYLLAGYKNEVHTWSLWSDEALQCQVSTLTLIGVYKGIPAISYRLGQLASILASQLKDSSSPGPVSSCGVFEHALAAQVGPVLYAAEVLEVIGYRSEQH